MRSLLPHINRANLRQHVLVTPWPLGACGGERVRGVQFAREVPRWIDRILLKIVLLILLSLDFVSFETDGALLGVKSAKGGVWFGFDFEKLIVFTLWLFLDVGGNFDDKLLTFLQSIRIRFLFLLFLIF